MHRRGNASYSRVGKRTRWTFILPLISLFLADLADAASWRVLAPGVDYATFATKGAGQFPLVVRDSRLHVVRVDSRRAPLRALMTSALGGKSRTAGKWADEQKLVAAINLGMFKGDHRTHVGYLRAGSHLNSRRWVRTYRSVLLFGPRKAGLPALQVLDWQPGQSTGADYRVVSQNLRLIASDDGKKGRGVWSRQDKRWSEAALGMDDTGRLLFFFTRAPFSMWELNRFLLRLPLGVVRAMHLEGGPEASLSLRGKGLHLDLAGSYETGFRPDDSNREQWALPNVLGVARQRAAVLKKPSLRP